MPTAERTITVNRPASDVFDYLADTARHGEWRAGVIEIERTSADDGLGATYRQVLAAPGGSRIDGDYRITAFERPRRLAFTMTAGPTRPEGAFELTENPDRSTKVRFVLEVKITGLMKLAKPIVTQELQRQVVQLDQVKAVLEAAS
jgi:uncharacterized protein YndB with AHSA1/START domain